MNYSYLENHEDFLKFVHRLDCDEAMAANYTGVLCDPAFVELGELIEFLGGDSEKYYKDNIIDEDDENFKEEEEILDYGPFSVEPVNYPAIAVWFFESSFDRGGDCSTKILNFISIPDLQKDKEIRTQLYVDEWNKK